MTPERQTYLFNRYFLKTATEAEEHELMQWLASQARDKEIGTLMDEAWEEFQTSRQLFTEQQSGRMLRQILQSGPTEDNIIPLQKRKPWLRFAAAAAILVLLSATIGWLFIREEKVLNTQAQNAVVPIPPIVEPANDKAILTLANGEQIVLDDAANGNISNQSGITVIKLNGQLNYNTPGSNDSKEIVYNTITTAKGKQYKLVLEDGSCVWLNAASSLRFPVSFPGNERRVELNGEGYFEIAKDIKRPFHVGLRSSNDTDKGTVTALGTSFNINSYDNESNIKTTLLSGSVGVSNQSGKSIVLKPGQQASFNSTQLRMNPEANTEQVLAWKNNLFNFDNENIEDIMRELTRWYNIDVRFEGPVPDKHYFGSIRRQVKLTEILDMLGIAGDIGFTLEGRTLFIKRR
ncbi:FecR family protein [Pseudoflavitalea rhizosphaerae]|uniref:FecR family protein n=1 Tax=Pseudoflavitalea rhizosphaerae TaxID=1884793 RepID=UPI000F8C9288|nr:FecR family protein [Pseudoflavitalea rhizosphaerae]